MEKYTKSHVLSAFKESSFSTKTVYRGEKSFIEGLFPKESGKNSPLPQRIQKPKTKAVEQFNRRLSFGCSDTRFSVLWILLGRGDFLTL